MKKTIEAILLPSLTLVIGFVVSPFLKGIWDYVANAVLPELSPQARLSLLATLAILCLLEGAWIWVLTSKKLLLKKYEPDERFSGIYLEKNTGEKVCGACLNKGVISPIIAHSFTDYSCATCKTPIREDHRQSAVKIQKKTEKKKA